MSRVKNFGRKTLIKNHKLKIILLLIALLVGIAIVSIFHVQQAKKAALPKKPTAPEVTVKTFAKRTIPLIVKAYGTTFSPHSVLLTAKAPGIITALHFQPGKPVKKDQLLMTIKLSNTSNTLDINMLKAQLTKSKLRYQRMLQANKSIHGMFSGDAIQKSFSDYQTDLAAYNNALAMTYIKAPVAGTVSDTTLSVGDAVKVDEPLLSIYNHDAMQLKYSLPSQYINQVKVGQNVVFTSGSNHKTYPAIVSYVSPQLDADSDEVSIRADFVDSSALQANIFGSLTQTLDKQHQSLALPQRLVQTDEQGFYVYVVQDHKVTKKYIETGNISAEGYIEISSGITSATPIIVSNYNNLSPGLNVSVKTS